MATSTKTSMTSYFFLFDFYHNRNTTEDATHFFLESIVYFYPNREEVKQQKEIEWRLLIGLMQCLRNDVFSVYPKEILHRNSLVKLEHYGRHCAFLILPKDRFTIDEADIHLKHILDIYHILYGTFNQVQKTHPDIPQMTHYLQRTMTPIVEHVFNENRSIRTLFSVVDYSPLKQTHALCKLQVKHLLQHLQNAFQIQDGLFAYEKRIVQSTFDIDTTYYIHVLLCSAKLSSILESSHSIRTEEKLKKGVSLIPVYILQTIDSDSDSTTVIQTTTIQFDQATLSEPIQIDSNVFTDTTTDLPSTYTNSTSRLTSTYTSDYQIDPVISSDDITEFDTDHTGYTSARSKTDETDSLLSYSNAEKLRRPLTIASSTIAYTSHDESSNDIEREIYSSARSSDERVRSKDNFDKTMFQTMTCDLEADDCTDCQPEDVFLLPKISRPDFPSMRRRTLTNAAADLTTSNNRHSDSDDPSKAWQNIPEKNNECEREEFVLYVQRNARITFAGLIRRRVLSDAYLQDLWRLLVTEMANLDHKIHVIPFAGENSRQSTDVKFQFHTNMHQAQYERISDQNKSFYKVPSPESACLALNGRNKLHMDPERQTIGISQGNITLSIKRNLPDREMYSWRQVQETR